MGSFASFGKGPVGLGAATPQNAPLSHLGVA